MAGKKFNRFFYLIYLAAVILAVDYWTVWRLRCELSRKVSDAALSEIEKKTGWTTVTRHRSYFTAFPVAKSSGVIRIGCFGDSYTVGEEVADGYAYPDMLQKIFKDNHADVEVLNFGVEAFGLFQAYRLWQTYGVKYSLDYIAFGPEGIWPQRDLTFNWLFYASFKQPVTGSA